MGKYMEQVRVLRQRRSYATQEGGLAESGTKIGPPRLRSGENLEQLGTLYFDTGGTPSEKHSIALSTFGER